MKTGIYVGIFDPITLAHLNIIRRAATMVDHLVIGVLVDSTKDNMSEVKARCEMIEKSCTEIANVTVDIYDGHLDEFVKKHNALVLIQSLNKAFDFENKLHTFQSNYERNKAFDTIFLVPDGDESFVTSDEIRDLVKHHGKYEQFIPKAIKNDVKSIYDEKSL